MCTCRCWKRPATCRRRSTPGRRRSSRTASAIAEHYDLYGDALFSDRGTELRWDARVAVGDHHRPWRRDPGPVRLPWPPGSSTGRSCPASTGSTTFGGHAFHTSRWDYAYTGGDGPASLTGLPTSGSGIIGTGATAVQCVPQLAPARRQLFVFQRTPSSVDVRANRPTDPEWFADPRARLAAASGMRELPDPAPPAASPTRTWSRTAGPTSPSASAPIVEKRPARLARAADRAASRLADYDKMEEIRARVDASSPTRHRGGAQTVVPALCKRPCFHDEYLQAFNRDNVTWSTPTAAASSRSTADGVVVDGVEHTSWTV